MGICHIYDPKFWKILRIKKVNETESDLYLEIGAEDNYPYTQVKQWMSKDTYAKILSGEYFIKKGFYSSNPLSVFDGYRELPLVNEFDASIKSSLELIKNKK